MCICICNSNQHNILHEWKSPVNILWRIAERKCLFSPKPLRLATSQRRVGTEGFVFLTLRLTNTNLMWSESSEPWCLMQKCARDQSGKPLSPHQTWPFFPSLLLSCQQNQDLLLLYVSVWRAAAVWTWEMDSSELSLQAKTHWFPISMNPGLCGHNINEGLVIVPVIIAASKTPELGDGDGLCKYLLEQF